VKKSQDHTLEQENGKMSISKNVASYFLSWAITRKLTKYKCMFENNVNLLCMHQQFDKLIYTFRKINLCQ